MSYSMDEIVNMMGIYQIRIGPVYYVGQSTSMAYRLGTHLNALRRGDHTNPLLQEAYYEFGEVTFEVLEETRKRGSLLPKEEFWIKYQVDSGKWLANKDRFGRSYNPRALREYVLNAM